MCAQTIFTYSAAYNLGNHFSLELNRLKEHDYFCRPIFTPSIVKTSSKNVASEKIGLIEDKYLQPAGKALHEARSSLFKNFASLYSEDGRNAVVEYFSKAQKSGEDYATAVIQGISKTTFTSFQQIADNVSVVMNVSAALNEDNKKSEEAEAVKQKFDEAVRAYMYFPVVHEFFYQACNISTEINSKTPALWESTHESLKKVANLSEKHVEYLEGCYLQPNAPMVNFLMNELTGHEEAAEQIVMQVSRILPKTVSKSMGKSLKTFCSQNIQPHTK